MNQRGFTLLEVLVATTILLILGALTTSAVVSSRERADGTRCASNLRLLASARARSVP